MRQPYLVPESLGVLEALADMRKHRRAVAVVVDEYGGVAGILTVKDLLEPLVGDLHDEFDEVEEPMIVRVDGTRWLIDGQTNVDVVRERLGMDVPDGEYVTLGGLLFERFGHIPTEGEQVRVGRLGPPGGRDGQAPGGPGGGHVARARPPPTATPKVRPDSEG